MPLHLQNKDSDVFVPDAQPVDAALGRISHLGIGAHQDDLEFMALHGIAECYDSDSLWFGGVVCTNGAGSSRTGGYAGFSDEQMMAVRKDEQRRAAEQGRYSAMVQLGYASAEAKDPSNSALQGDLGALFAMTRPRIVYTHNLADKHDTHVAVALHVIRALRQLPRGQRPESVVGCEVWRGLDWLQDADKVAHDVSGREALAAELGQVFASQVAGGKRYDLAVMGRRRANATFFESHRVDRSSSLDFAMDLTPLVHDDTLDPSDYALGFIERFRADVAARINRYRGRG